MTEYWMDSDSLMTPKDGAYAFKLLPQFWELVEAKAIEGVIASSSFVYDEICDAYDHDPLKQWAQARKGPPLFLTPCETAQQCMNEVAEYVNSAYNHRAWIEHFLSKADPWMIAQCKAHGGKIVTFETLHGQGAHEPKIPNVCRALGLPDPINTWEMLTEMNVSFARDA